VDRLAGSNNSLWMEAEKLVMMMEATSSRGNRRSPSAVLQVNCPSRQLNEHCGESMLTM
jgi:hypothetical protein